MSYFASRLREARDQAKLAVQNLELPNSIPSLNFDDMAARDEYIHSDEFNVQGQPKMYEKQKKMVDGVVAQHHPDQLQDNATMTSNGEMTASCNAASVSTAGSSSAWSLLDRPSNASNMKTNSNTVAAENLVVSVLFTKSSETSAGTNSRESPGTASASLSSSNPALLPIVMDTLQETSQAAKTTRSISPTPSILSSSSSNPSRRSHSHNLDDDDDDDSLDDDSHDENDPILSIIHQRRSSSDGIRASKRGTRQDRKKNPNRFMEDLDRRLETREVEGETQKLTMNASSLSMMEKEQHSSTKLSPYFTKGPFGGTILNMAIQNFHQVVQGPEISRTGSTTTTPPLARDRPHTSSSKSTQEEFHVTNSSSVLSSSELEELKRHSVGSQWPMLTLLSQGVQEHQNYLFIAFTLILTLFIYFKFHSGLQIS